MEIVLVAILFAAVIGVLLVIGGRRATRERQPGLDEGTHRGPTGEAYPRGSNPAGPGAEGMGVSSAGDIVPGAPPVDDDDLGSGADRHGERGHPVDGPGENGPDGPPSP